MKLLSKIKKDLLDIPGYESGLIPQNHDERDLLYVPRSGNTIIGVDLRETSTPVRNQVYNSCAAYSTGDLILSHIRQLTDHSQFIELNDGISYSYLWYNMRLLEGTENKDVGVMLRDSFKAIKKYGWCLRKHHDNHSHWSVKPSNIAYIRGYLTTQFIDMFFKEYRTVLKSQVINTLNDGHRIVFGMLIGNNFVGLRGRDVKIRTSDRKLGGHAMLIEGYKEFDDETFYLIKNSWGTRWGDQGYFWLSKELFDATWTMGGGFDLWTIK